VYAIDPQRRIVYCNAALADWFGLEINQIVGREVEYHSETVSELSGDASAIGVESPLASLCPPPRTLAGEPARGTISCVARDGRLVHRQADFIPLAATLERDRPRGRNKTAAVPQGGGVLILLAATDMSPQDLASQLTEEPTADELHRVIRRFRRTQAAAFSMTSLLGESSAIRKVRDQATAAIASGANVLITGAPGTGKSHLAHLIYYGSTADPDAKMIPLDCRLLTDDLLRRTFDTLGDPPHDTRRRTVILNHLEQLTPAYQAQFLNFLRRRPGATRWIAAINTPIQHAREGDFDIDAKLLDAISTITIQMPRLLDRLEDLPVLAQYFLEASNRGNQKQVGALRPEVLDRLALYSWPGELDELCAVVTSAHQAATTHEVTLRDLPSVVHHANDAAECPPHREPERIILDELLATIEKEVIQRALDEAKGNKTMAASLLGMSRPRLYRRLVQIGLAIESADDRDDSVPEFIERDASEADP
jgi:DNA-binding NtrC family response regulator